MAYGRTIFIGVGMLVLSISLTLLWCSWISWRYAPAIYVADQVTPMRVAIVFGARVYPDGRLSTMLRDRVDTAIRLYKSGKVQKLLVSGDNRFVDYDEPGAMMAYAIAHGVPKTDIQPDYGGRRTYDTCYRARAIFQVKEAILVTQAFHLPRALFVCDQLGLQVQGVVADRHVYAPAALAWSQNRELVALVAAGLDIVRRAPPPVLGPPIPF
jgi:SanA protein